MKSTRIQAYAILSVFFLNAQISWAAIINAASADRADIEAAIAAASDGDVIAIPTDLGTGWNAPITITKAITLQGAGIGATIIREDIASGGKHLLIWETVAGKIYRMSGIEFTQGSSNTSNGVMALRGEGTVVFGNLKFNQMSSWCFFVNDSVLGVVYDTDFTAHGDQAFYFRQQSLLGGTGGDGSWENPVDWGGSGFFFIEGCSFGRSASGAVDGNGGSRVVFRHNILTDSKILFHGTDSGGLRRGGRAMEVYNNNFHTNDLQPNAIVSRSGTFIVHNNTLTGNYGNNGIHLTAYRRFYNGFNVWGGADGTFLWDGNDLTDGPSTPGGAGDGVFESGVSTGGGEHLLVDNTKNWTVNEWVGYILRQAHSFTATAGSNNQVTVSGAGWTSNEWRGFIITKGGQKGEVESNTANTINLVGSPWANMSFSSGNAFTLSRGVEIVSNTSTQITTSDGQGSYDSTDTSRTVSGDYELRSGDPYEIRRVSWMLDQSGRGASSPFPGNRPANTDLNQTGTDPCYQWSNTKNGSSITNFQISGTTIKSGRDYFNSSKPGYTPYTYPHPLRSGISVPDAPSNLQVNP